MKNLKAQLEKAKEAIELAESAKALVLDWEKRVMDQMGDMFKNVSFMESNIRLTFRGGSGTMATTANNRPEVYQALKASATLIHSALKCEAQRLQSEVEAIQVSGLGEESEGQNNG
jgi:hypothetical protein